MTLSEASFFGHIMAGFVAGSVIFVYEKLSAWFSEDLQYDADRDCWFSKEKR